MSQVYDVQNESEPSKTCCYTDPAKEKAQLMEDEEYQRRIYDFGVPINLDYREVYQDDEMELEKTAMDRCAGRYIVKNYRHIFHWTQALLYYLLAIPIGFIMAAVWGLVYAANRLVLVWIFQPLTKLIFTWWRMFGFWNRVGIRTCCDPFTEAVNIILTKLSGSINVSAHIHKTSDKPTSDV